MIGWTYFVMWTISFYPQLIKNWRRKSVEGLSFDYMLLNVAGFLAYTIFNLSMVLSPVVEREYRERFGAVGVPVELNDVLFGIHAMLLSLALAVQCLIYPRGASQGVSAGTRIGLVVAVAAGAGYAGCIAITGELEAPWTWLDFVYFCSSIKMAVTLVKYVPQVHMNFSRQSTDGWSIDNVLLDLGGGVLSLAQLLVSCLVLHDWTAVSGNPIKIGLGLASLGFDIVFMLQHYLWYPGGGAAAAGEADVQHKLAAASEELQAPLLLLHDDEQPQPQPQAESAGAVVVHVAAAAWRMPSQSVYLNSS